MGGTSEVWPDTLVVMPSVKAQTVEIAREFSMASFVGRWDRGGRHRRSTRVTTGLPSTIVATCQEVIALWVAVLALLPGLTAGAPQQQPAPKAAASSPVTATRPLKPGAILKDCTVCPELVVLPKGSFEMGSTLADVDSRSHELPRRRVTIGKHLAVGRFEVTRAEFVAFLSSLASDSQKNYRKCKVWAPDRPYSPWSERDEHSWLSPGFEQSGEHPVTCVSWHDAQSYVAWLNNTAAPHKGYRLLSEAEWEYAARAGKGNQRYPWGADLRESQLCAWANLGDKSFKNKMPGKGNWEVAACDDQYPFTAPGKAFKPNAFGLYNMHGNVWEWVQDIWHDSYDGAPADGSAWVSPNGQTQARRALGRWTGKVLRGGSWASLPEDGRSAARSWHPEGERFSSGGFRVVRAVSEPEAGR